TSPGLTLQSTVTGASPTPPVHALTSITWPGCVSTYFVASVIDPGFHFIWRGLILPLHVNVGVGITAPVLSTLRQRNSSYAPLSHAGVRVVPRSSVPGHPLPASTAGLVGSRAMVIMDAELEELPWVGPPFANSPCRPTLASPTLLWSPVLAKA